MKIAANVSSLQKIVDASCIIGVILPVKMGQDKQQKVSVAIIGAGPAGLTAAYQLAKAGGFHIDIFEADPVYVGGISRTETYKGFHFDIGGHRFFSKSPEVENFWTEILGDEMLERARSSSIYYNHRFFDYPLVAGEVLRKLGLAESIRCVASYLQARLNPVKNPENFEDWISNQFGKRLFRIFFKTYTEKVWGVDCKEISADWAAQRIKGLSLSAAVKNMIFPQKNSDGKLVKTLIDSFRYPKYGPGQMWETCRRKAEAMGVKVFMGQKVIRLSQTNEQKWTLETERDTFDEYDYVISSAPVRHLIKSITNAVPVEVKQAAESLAYRDFITVVLILKERNLFHDNWIYIHDPAVKVGRIQNFKSWSPFMVPDSELVCYGLEYFCFEGDQLWESNDAALTLLGMQELMQIGLANKEDLLDSYVVRQAKAYPVYDHSYQQHMDTVKSFLKTLPGLILVGRNGMHKYNNQDHSMMTAMLAVKNIISGVEQFDLWKVNQDAEYHEDGERSSKAGRMVPTKVANL